MKIDLLDWMQHYGGRRIRLAEALPAFAGPQVVKEKEGPYAGDA